MLTEQEIKNIEKYETEKFKAEQLNRQVLLGLMTPQEYEEEIKPTLNYITELEQSQKEADTRARFDEMMGNPLKQLDKLGGLI